MQSLPVPEVGPTCMRGGAHRCGLSGRARVRVCDPDARAPAQDDTWFCLRSLGDDFRLLEVLLPPHKDSCALTLLKNLLGHLQSSILKTSILKNLTNIIAPCAWA